MRGLSKFAITTAAGMVGVLALAAGCGTKSGSSDSTNGQRQDPIAAMIKDVSGTVSKMVDTTSKAKSASIRMAGTSAGKKTNAHGVIQFGSPPQAEITTTIDAGSETVVRMFGPIFYVQIPAAQRAALRGKSWMRMDLTTVGKDGAAVAKQFDDIDPSRQVKMLLDSGTVTAVGQEDVGGVRTVHYSGTAPVDKYLGNLDESLRSTAQQELSAQGATDVKTDIWVDEQYQPRRAHVVLGTTDLTTDYSDYGKPVSVETPPAADTVDFDDLMRSLPGGQKTGG